MRQNGSTLQAIADEINRIELETALEQGQPAPEKLRSAIQEQCDFAVGEKVLCLMFEGYDAVFPAIVLGPLTEEYLRKLYDEDEVCQIHYSSADELIANWIDWNWDSVIVKPLVKINNELYGPMGDSVIVNRVYVFPYKKFEL